MASRSVAKGKPPDHAINEFQKAGETAPQGRGAHHPAHHNTGGEEEPGKMFVRIQALCGKDRKTGKINAKNENIRFILWCRRVKLRV